MANHGFSSVTRICLGVLIFLLASCAWRTTDSATQTPPGEPPPVETQGNTPALPPTDRIETALPSPDTSPMATSETPLTSPTAGHPAAFGILAVIPGGSGSTGDAAAVNAVAASGAEYMRVSLDWAISEPEAGALHFDTRNDQLIARIEAAGLRVFPTLYVGRGWMNGTPPGRDEGGSRSYPPDDLGDQWNDQTGYSPGYYNFVYQFFEHYRGHFDYVVIENEANSMLFWGGTAEEYVRLLKTAYQAIKTADPQVRVVDSGFVSVALGLCIADDGLRNQWMSEADILQFAIDYYSGEPGGRQIRTAADLQQYLGRPRVQEQCQRINTMLDTMGGSLDALNFHFYENYRSLPTVVQWLRMRSEQAGYQPAIVTNEMGSRGTGQAYAGTDAPAQEVFKKLVTARALGLEAVIWFSADTVQAGKDKVGLFDETGGLRPAGEAYHLVATTLNADLQPLETAASGPDLYHYRFGNSDGVLRVEALWSEDKEQTVQLTAPAGVTQAEVVDFLGRSETMPVEEGLLSIDLGSEPVFVFW